MRKQCLYFAQNKDVFGSKKLFKFKWCFGFV